MPAAVTGTVRLFQPIRAAQDRQFKVVTNVQARQGGVFAVLNAIAIRLQAEPRIALRAYRNEIPTVRGRAYPEDLLGVHEVHTGHDVKRHCQSSFGCDTSTFDARNQIAVHTLARTHGRLSRRLVIDSGVAKFMSRGGLCASGVI
jgi:hypothetical protein